MHQYQFDQVIYLQSLSAETLRANFATQAATFSTNERVVWDSQPLQCGMEILVVESFLEGYDYAITELYRFDDAGSKRLRFADGCVEIAPELPMVRVVFRSATNVAIEQFLFEHPEVLADKSVILAPANLKVDPNLSDAAVQHANELERILKERREVSRCLHCGREINHGNALLVEVDEERLPLNFGATHEDCRRPTDRVCGRMQIRGFPVHELLRDFDLTAWAKAVVKGQRGLQWALRSASKKKFSRIHVMYWTPENLTTGFGTWCLRLACADNSERYVKSRGRVERMGQPEANAKAERIREWFKKAAELADPFCYSEDGTFGTRRDLDAEYRGGNFVECRTVDVVKYSTVFEEHDGDWYAPLCFIIDRNTDQICTLLGHAIPMFSNPLEIGNYLDNWKESGIEFGEIAVRSILTDVEFDLQCKQWLDEGMFMVIDPRFGEDGQLAESIVISDWDTWNRYVSKMKSEEQK